MHTLKLYKSDFSVKIHYFKTTLKPALASKLALIRMPLYKPCWYMHG